MAADGAWQILGIGPTDEVRAIKRAYGQKLKAIDVEANPDAFIALRAALEDAVWQAETGCFSDGDADEDANADANADADDESAGLEGENEANAADYDADEYDDEDAWYRDTPRPECADIHQARIVDLLWGDAPVDEIADALKISVNAILSDPEMENIDHAANVEDWLSWVITDTMPRSDVLLDPVVQYFRWGTRAKSVYVPYAILTAAKRQADRRRLANMEGMGHTILQLLKKDAPESLGWIRRVSQKNAVQDFLADIRSHNPTIEWALNPAHVAMWDDQLRTPDRSEAAPSPMMRWLPWLVAWLIIQVLLRINHVW